MTVSALKTTAVPMLALHSLSERQADGIVAGLAGACDQHALERHYSYDGHLYIILSHGSDLTLVVDRDAAGIHIGFMQFDIFQRCKPVHTSVASVVLAITALLSDSISAVQHRVA